MYDFEQFNDRLNQIADDVAFLRGQLADLPAWKVAAEGRLQRLETNQAYQRGIAAVIAGGISAVISGAAAWLRWGHK